MRPEEAPDCDGDCDTADPEWWCPRYRNRGNLCDFLGDTQPLGVEVLAVRVAQWINSCRSLDWCYEYWTTTLLRETAPGFRVSLFLISVVVVIVPPVFLDEALVLKYSLTHDDEEHRWSDATMSVCLYMWTLDLAILCTSYYFVKHHGGETFLGDAIDIIPFRAAPPAKLREERDEAPVTVYTLCSRIAHGIFYAAYFFFGVLCTHTLLTQVYQRRNPYFASLLILQCVLAFFASIADLTFIGSPWGIQEASKTASVLLSARGLFLIPLTIIWSGCALAAAFPPYYCREC